MRVVQIVLNSNTKFVDVSNVRSDCVFIIDWNDFCECHHVFFFDLATIELFKLKRSWNKKKIIIFTLSLILLYVWTKKNRRNQLCARKNWFKMIKHAHTHTYTYTHTHTHAKYLLQFSGSCESILQLDMDVDVGGDSNDANEHMVIRAHSVSPTFIIQLDTDVSCTPNLSLPTTVDC